jgi:catechol 2,3-dioxygenase-like lactoylglutathione lyase family enzyme
VVSDNIFVKTKANALTSGEFTEFIEKNGINEFFVAGADATGCVKSTCFNMTKAGYSVHVISDCVTSYDLKKMDEMYAYYAKKGCEVKELKDYMEGADRPEDDRLARAGTKWRQSMRLDGFGLLVEDMGKMIRFYRDVLGFEIKEEENTSNVYFVKDGTLFLLYGRKDFEKMTSRRYEYIKGLNGHFEIALYVDTFEEVDEAYKKAVENGATSVLEPELEPWGQRTCYIADPEGNLIEIGSWNKSYETKDLTEGC